ncbi:MAG TPA: hypothetical protein VJR02_24515 [Pyrinomonadaceae bacterium]|nr:hypothetical protein [Pyrinomonadaceae bacterium]
MGVLDWFKSRFKDEAKKYIYTEIDPSHVKFNDNHQINPQPLKAGTHYFRLWLVEMFLKNDRDWFKSWHPAVHSAISFTFGDKTELITHVAGPTRLKDIGPANLDKVVTVNRPLTSLVPFNGGEVAIDAGLLAMEGKDDLKGFLNVLGDFSSLLVVPQLSAALAIATPLAKGVSELVGSTNGKLVLGLSDTWTGGAGGGNLLREKYFTVILAKENEINKEKLWVENDRLKYGDAQSSSKLLTGYNYMLFRIERQDEFDSWDSLTSIKEPFDQALLLLKAGNKDEAAALIKQAKLAAYNAKELTRDIDSRRIIEIIQQRFDTAKEFLGSAAFEEFDRSLTTAMSASGVMSPEEAASKGRLRIEDLRL